MTRWRVVMLSVAAGLLLGGVGYLVDASGYLNCDSMLVRCTAQTGAFWAILLVPWSGATVILASKRAVSPFSCLMLGFALTLGMWVWGVVSAELNLDHDYVGNDDVWMAWFAGVGYLIVGVPAVAFVTALVGSGLQRLFHGRNAPAFRSTPVPLPPDQ